MGYTNLGKSRKCTNQALDEKSLEVLELIDSVIKRQYLDNIGDEITGKVESDPKDIHKTVEFSAADRAPENINKTAEFSKADNNVKNFQTATEFSEAYQARKKLLLEGKVDEVRCELGQNRRKRAIRKWHKIAAAVVIVFLCGILLIGPKRIYASIRTFGNALVRVFQTHTELEFDQSPDKNLHEKLLDISELNPDDFSLAESFSTENKKYVLFENSHGLWISLNQSYSSNTTLNFDSEAANISEYMVQSTSVTKYSSYTKTSFLWHIGDVNYLLSGNADDKLLQKIVDKLICTSIGEN